MELRHLRYFVALAEELHFGRAARRLHISQPPLSQQIAALEQEVGVALLRRTSRTVELTEAGRRFLEGARQTLSQAEHTREVARHAGRGEIGRLQVGFVPACGVVPAVIRRFVRRFPEVHLTLRSMVSAEQLAGLLDGRLDAGFVHLPLHVAGLAAEVVQSVPLVVALPSRHRLAREARVSWAALDGEPFIGFPRTSAPAAYDAIHTRLREAGIFPRYVHETDSLLARLRMVGAGLGISLLPSYADGLPRPGVVLRPLASPPLAAAIGVVHCPTRVGPVLSRFMEVVHEVVKG